MTRENEEMLVALKSAVSEILEKKHRLEHYAVVWKNNHTVIIENNDKKISRRRSTDQ